MEKIPNNATTFKGIPGKQLRGLSFKNLSTK